MTSSKFSDPEFLRTDQYRHPGNLNARSALHEHFSTNPHGWPRWVFGQYGFPKRARVLVLGGGPGIIWGANQERTGEDWEVVFSDLSEGMLAEARQKLTAENIQYACLDAQALPFPQDYFDAITANHMLYHLPDLPRAFKEICRVLKPGGKLLVGTNGDDHLKEFAGILNRFDPEISYQSPKLGFTLENGEPQLREFFERVEQRSYPDSLAVTEAEPLAAYFASLTNLPQVSSAGQSPELLTYLNNMLADKGVIEITKSVGVFICRLG